MMSFTKRRIEAKNNGKEIPKKNTIVKNDAGE